jgi:hypothetical protein
LQDHDLDFDIRAEDVHMAGVSADALDTAFRLRDGLLEVDRLAVTGLEGADIEASGSMRDFAGTPRGTIEATIASPDLRRLIALAADRLPENRLVGEIVRRVDAYPELARDASLALRLSTSGWRARRAGADGQRGRAGWAATRSRCGPPRRTGTTRFRFRCCGRAWRLRRDDAVDLFALVGLPGELEGFAGPAQAELTLDGGWDGRGGSAHDDGRGDAREFRGRGGCRVTASPPRAGAGCSRAIWRRS